MEGPSTDEEGRPWKVHSQMKREDHGRIHRGIRKTMEGPTEEHRKTSKERRKTTKGPTYEEGRPRKEGPTEEHERPQKDQ